jgi:hypothetical protein
MLRELLAVVALAAAALWFALERLYRDAFIETARGAARELARVARLPALPDAALGPAVQYGPAIVLIAIAAALLVSGLRRRERLRAAAREELKRRSRS